MTSKETRWIEEVIGLYVDKGMSPEDIAERIPVSAKTIRSWADKHDMNKMRRQKIASGRQIVELMEGLILRKLADMEGAAEITPGDFDSINKMYKTLDRIRNGTLALSAAAIETFEKFSLYLRQMEDDQAFLDKLANHMRAFMESID